jgi:hypothetical protein
MGKKDIGTERMIHTNNWYITHYDSILYSLGGRLGSAVYRFPVPNGFLARFIAPVEAILMNQTGGSVNFRYGSSTSPLGDPSLWYDHYGDVLSGSYLFVEVLIARSGSHIPSPVIQDMKIFYEYADFIEESNSGSTGSVSPPNSS